MPKDCRNDQQGVGGKVEITIFLAQNDIDTTAPRIYRFLVNILELYTFILVYTSTLSHITGVLKEAQDPVPLK